MMSSNIKEQLNKPRILYGSIFTWLALSGGRFTAPFLKEEAHFSDINIGTALALQTIVSSLCGYFIGGRIADYYEERYYKKEKKNFGRIIVLRAGIYIGSTAFLLHGVVSHYYEGVLHDGDADGSNRRRAIMCHTCLRIVYAIGMALCMPVLDGLTISYLKSNSGRDPKDYGKERLHGAIWWAVANLVIGPCVDIFGFKVFYISCLFSATVSIIATYLYMHFSDCNDGIDSSITTLEKVVQPDESSTNGNHNKIVQLLIPCLSIYGILYLFCYFVVGMGTSVVESLIFLFFEFSLGSSNTMCGLTVVVTVIFEIPIFHLSPYLLKKVGHDVLLLVSCIAYIVRVLGYSYIPSTHRYLVLFLEPLHGVTYAASKTSGVEFISLITPEGFEASGQGLLNIILGLGSFLGLILGGWLEEVFDPRFMYRVFAFLVFTGSFLFALFCLLRAKKNTFIVKEELNHCVDESTRLVQGHATKHCA